MPVRDQQIRTWTIQDPLLNKVVHHIQQGWPNHCEQSELKPYWARRTELCCLEGCILWGTRVLMMLANLGGITHWPSGDVKNEGISLHCHMAAKSDTEIEEMVRCCNECQMTRLMPPVALLNPLPWPVKPWSRKHIDFASPFKNHMFLTVINAGSKWIEPFSMSTVTSKATIQCLRTFLHNLDYQIF